MKINLYLKKGILLLLCGISYGVFAQNGTLSGKVVDAEDSEPIFGAQVYVAAFNAGAVTDIEGNYSFDLPAGPHEVVASFVGYLREKQTVTITSGGTQNLDFSLTKDILGLDEVVVTATFSERSLFESPQSITRLNADALGLLTANSQADILRTVPGITAEGGGGEVASNVFVRGLPSGGQYQFTPLQVDGLPVLSAFGLNSSAHDVYFRNDIGIENLEFVRGGVSTLFGAGSVAGIINYTSRVGSVIPENIIQLEWADQGRLKGEFMSSGPINDRTFVAVSGFYRYDAGPLESGLLTEGTQIRGNLKRLSKDGFGSFTISGQYINDNVQFYLPYPLDNDNGNYKRPKGNDGKTIYTMLTGEAREFSFDTPNGVFETPIEKGVVTRGGYVMMDFQRSFENEWAISAKGKFANYDHQFNLFLDGDGIHNVPETQDDYLADRGLPSADSATFVYVNTGQELNPNDLLFENRVLDRNRPMRELVLEANLSKQFGDHYVTFGTFNSYTQAEDDNWLWNYLGDFRNAPLMVGLQYVDRTSGDTLLYSNDGFIRGNQTANRHHAMSKSAIYLAEQYSGDRFSLDVGLRWETARGFITRETGVGTNTFQKGEVSADDITVALAGMYKINRSWSVYLNGSRGYFFPEIRSVQFSAPGVPQSYETEEIWQGELGAKYGSSNISANVAAYYVALNDRRSVEFENDGFGGVIERVAVQSTRTFGIEGSLNYYITNALNLYGNFTFQSHEVVEDQTNPEFNGKWLKRQPRAMGLIGVMYKNYGFDGNFSVNFLGKKFANDANTVELDGYNIGRLDLGYTFDFGQKETMRLGLSIFNLFNDAGITEGSPRQGNTQVGEGGEFFVGRPILPRRFFVRATFKF